MHALRHRCSVELRLDPGAVTHLSKQFVLTLLIRTFALATLACSLIALWMRCNVADVVVGSGLVMFADGVVDASESLDDEDDEPPPKKPPKDILQGRWDREN